MVEECIIPFLKSICEQEPFARQRRWSMTLESKWYCRVSSTLDRKWSKWRGRHPAATNLSTQFDRRASFERSSDLTPTTSPQFIVDSLLLSPHSLVIV
ncbi:hypothetical protein KIN20_005161 [Parelaphostrongylus tenuis]|uniref:Uncharacterized protein n=1 Tax=Parelaphostrongylus tenuis TaxID=148309 RepID=A0AAD5QID7_PARTN|nr:hypothetical protein KIN20_005161 [Parelaphostrongylus tenuis]